jgi:hypothetical protein
MAILKSTGQ